MVTWVEYAGATIDGTWLPFVWIDGSQLRGWQGGPVLEGDALIGARFVARSDTNKWLKLRVVDVEPPEDGDLDDGVWHYGVEYLETNGKWYPICQDASGAFGAIAVDGQWNYKRKVARGIISTSVRYAYAEGFQFSSARAEQELGYTITPIERAIADAIAWFRGAGMLASAAA